LPDTFPQRAGYFQDGVGLVDAEVVHIAPLGAGCWKPADLKEAAEHGIQTGVNEMPDSVKADKQ